MKPTSFSATALQTADGCLARYKAEVIDRGRGPQGDAAQVGLICHETLEDFVRGTQIKRNTAWDETLILHCFEQAYMKVMGADKNKPEYADAHALVLKWFRTPGRKEYFDEVQVVSLEAKNNFMIPVVVTRDDGSTVKENIPVNYIMDRVDRIGPHEYRIVDYKTNRIPLTHEQLRNKIQARLYALALQIIHKDAEKIWVEFDFLRHEAIGVLMTKDENAETWRMLKRAAQRIIDTPDDEAMKLETINDECTWCVRKTTCDALKRNQAVGGIFSLDVEGAATRFAEVKAQIKALGYMEQELESYLLGQLIAEQTIDLDLDKVRVKLKRSSRRQIDSRAVAEIVGPAIAAEIGSFTVSSIDELIKSGRLSQDQVNKIHAVMSTKLGDPKIDVTIKKGA